MTDLFARATEMLRTGEPVRLDPKVRSVQFLRGAFSLSSMCLPAFYYFLGSCSARATANSTDDYPFQVAQAYLEVSNLNTLTLACRKIFDHATKPDLTGANFGKARDRVLSEHAVYWSERSGRHPNECFDALIFLRKVFAEYSKTNNVLLRASSSLSNRIGLLKQHADRAAAHLSLDDYSLDTLDLAHFAATITIVGEIVRSFDRPDLGEAYFNQLDTAAFQAAKKVFPQITEFHLFGHMQVHQQANYYWKCQDRHSVQSCFDKLHWALG